MGSIDRKDPRFAAAVGIKFYVGNHATDARTRNVSRGGLCADLASSLPIGTDVDVEITLVFDDRSKSEPLRVPARVVWCTPVENAYQVGVSFRPLDNRRAEYLRMFLEYPGTEKAPRTKQATNIDDRFG